MKKRVFIALSIYVAAVVVLSWALIHEFIMTKYRYEERMLESQANSLVVAVQKRYELNKRMLESLGGFVKSSTEITYPEWLTYIKGLDLNTQFPSVSWLAYVENVPLAEASAFIEKQSQNLGMPYKIWPNYSGNTLYPIVYVAPTAYQKLLGYNFAVDQENVPVLNRSIQSGQIAIGRPLSIITDKVNETHKILYCPIISENVNAPQGWVLAEIDFSIILQETYKRLNIHNLELKVYSGERVDSNNLIYQQNLDFEKTPSVTVTKPFEFGGQTWTFVMSYPKNGAPPMRAITFYLIFLLLLVTLAFGLFLYFFYLKKNGGDNLGMTQETKILSSTEYAFIATDTKGVVTYFNLAAENLLGYKAGEMVGKLTPEAFHDPEEMKVRAEELSGILGRQVQPAFEVFVLMAEKSQFDNRRWIYIRKDKSRVVVQLSVSVLKNDVGEIIGYLGVAIEASHLSI